MDHPLDQQHSINPTVICMPAIVFLIVTDKGFISCFHSRKHALNQGHVSQLTTKGREPWVSTMLNLAKSMKCNYV